MPQESQTRYHGLDALRGIAMMIAHGMMSPEPR